MVNEKINKKANSRFDSVINKVRFSKSKRSTSPLKQGYHNKITPCSKRSNSYFYSAIENNIFSKSKHSQMTIFIVLAIAIAIVLILIFTYREDLTVILTPKTPINEIKDCIKDSVQEGIDIINVQGGSIEPQNYYLYEGNKVDYICYTEENYKPCIMQKPLLKQDIQKELEDYSKPKIKGCMDSAKTSLEKKGYSVSFKEPEVTIELVPSDILINIDSDLKIAKDGTESHKSIKMDIHSKLYNLVMITSSIANWEARYGDSETLNYMLNYPSLKVEKKKQGDGTTIYILTNRNTLEKFIFAIRSVVVPAGITGE